jgi:hypothetical protein
MEIPRKGKYERESCAIHPRMIVMVPVQGSSVQYLEANTILVSDFTYVREKNRLSKNASISALIYLSKKVRMCPR